MFEMFVVAAAMAGLVVLAKGFGGSHRFPVDRDLATSKAEDGTDDLPCPWCYAPTHESDRRCGGCGRAFG